MTAKTTTFIETAEDTILLRDDKLYDLGGKIYSLAELRQFAMDSDTYREHLKVLNETGSDAV